MNFITLKTMLKIALTLVLFLFNTAYGQNKDQNTEEFQTLFGNEASYGGYGGFSIGYTQIAGRNTFISGIKGAWIINHGIGIGIGGSGFFSEMESGIIPEEEWSAITGGYGGFLIEPILFGSKPVHVSIPLLIGGGAVVYGNDLDYYYGNYPGYGSNYSSYIDYYFVFEPGIELEFNLTNFFRLATGVTYRFTSDVSITRTVNDIEYQVIKPGDLRSFNAYLVFKFGKF